MKLEHCELLSKASFIDMSYTVTVYTFRVSSDMLGEWSDINRTYDLNFDCGESQDVLKEKIAQQKKERKAFYYEIAAFLGENNYKSYSLVNAVSEIFTAVFMK